MAVLVAIKLHFCYFIHARILIISFSFWSNRTMPGKKKLSILKTSSSFQWNAPEVMSLCSQGSLYIMTNRLPVKWPVSICLFDRDGLQQPNSIATIVHKLN